MKEALAFLQTSVIEQGLIPGGQVSAWPAGDPAPTSGAVGFDALGLPLDEASMFATYCMGKPLLALGLARLVQQGELSFDDQIGDLLSCSTDVGRQRVVDYLDHRVELDVPDSIAAVLLDRGAYRAGLLAGTARPRGEPQYSEFAAWQLLALAADATVGGDLVGYIDDQVLQPLGLIDDVCTRHWRTIPLDRARVNGATRRPHQFTPLLAERCGWLEWAQSPGFGGYMTIAASVRMLGEILRSAEDGGLLPHHIAGHLIEPGPVHHDHVLNRTCQFGHGVFTNMQWFGLEDIVSEQSFGQMGLLGMSGVVADRTTGDIVGYHLAGYTDVGTMNDWLRPALISRLLGAMADG